MQKPYGSCSKIRHHTQRMWFWLFFELLKNRERAERCALLTSKSHYCSVVMMTITSIFGRIVCHLLSVLGPFASGCRDRVLYYKATVLLLLFFSTLFL